MLYHIYEWNTKRWLTINVAAALIRTLSRCFHSSAHSRSVRRWSITSSWRAPCTAKRQTHGSLSDHTQDTVSLTVQNSKTLYQSRVDTWLYLNKNQVFDEAKMAEFQTPNPPLRSSGGAFYLYIEQHPDLVSWVAALHYPNNVWPKPLHAGALTPYSIKSKSTIYSELFKVVGRHSCADAVASCLISETVWLRIHLFPFGKAEGRHIWLPQL